MRERRQIERQLADILATRPEVLFAYVFGSFAEPGVPFRDVDVGVYLEPSYAKGVDQFAYEAKLSLELGKTTGVEVDVHVINRAPVSFAHNVLQGKVIFCRDDEQLSDYIEHISQEWCDFEHLFHEGLKDLLHWNNRS